MKTIDTSVIQKVSQAIPKSLPPNLCEDPPRRSVSDFNPNRFFELLTELKPKQGFVLDYLLHRSRLGSHVSVYFRQKESSPFQEKAEMDAWSQKHKLADFLNVPQTENGYFQLAVFYQYFHQFYCTGHGSYDSVSILSEPEEPQWCIPTHINSGSETLGELPPLPTEPSTPLYHLIVRAHAVRTFPSAPTVSLGKDKALVEFTLFSKWGGLARVLEEYSIRPPHRLIQGTVIQRVEYHCGLYF